MKTLIVNEKYNNKKLNTFLLDNFKGLSMNTLYKALRKKDIRVNDKRISNNVQIHTGDKISVYITDDLLFSNSIKSVVFSNILYEDSNILLVNKPADLETVSGSSSEVTLSSILAEKYASIAPCHRLDRNTSGIVIFAKNEASLNILLDKFKNREIDKFYKCIVYGIPKIKKNVLEAYHFKDTRKSLVYISDVKKDNYKKIITEYSVLEEYKNNNTALLEVVLHTGKTHQIRAHLAHIGYPIVGDGKYGRNEINNKFKVKKQLLCAYKICFNFSSDSSVLDYLNGKSFEIKENF